MVAATLSTGVQIPAGGVPVNGGGAYRDGRILRSFDGCDDAGDLGG